MLVTYTFSCDWNDDGDFSDANENLTPNVLKAKWTRGRSYGSHIHGRSQPGKLTMTLSNLAGIYSPTNAASPLFGNLLQGRKVRVIAGEGGTNYTRFTGRIDKIIPRIGPFANRPEVEITALGMLDDLAYVKPRTTVFEGLNTYELVQVVLDYSRKGYAEFIQDDSPVAIFRMNVPEVLLPAGAGGDFNFFPSTNLDYRGFIQPGSGALATEQEVEYRLGTARLTRLLGEVNGYVALSSSLATDILNGTASWSLDFPVKFNDFPASPSFATIFSTGATGELFMGTQLVAGVRSLFVTRRTGQTVTVTSNTTVKLNTLQHIGVKYDGLTLTLYVDGVSVGTPDNDATAITVAGLEFGNNGVGNAATLMSLGPVALYDTALATARFAAHSAYNFIGTELVPVTSTEWTGVDAWWADGSKTGLDLIRELENTEFGFFRELGDGTFIFEDKAYRLRETTSIVSQHTLTDTPAGSLFYLDSAQLEDLKLQIVNIAEATGHVLDDNQENEVILWELQPPMPSIGPGETKRFLATFNGDGYWRYRFTTDAGVIGPLEIEVLSYAVIPLATGAMIFVENSGTSPVTLTHLRFHGQTWTRHSPVTMYEANDPTSIATYKSERQYRNTTPWLYGPDKAQAYADMAVYLLKDPTPLVRLPFFANETATKFHDLMELEISERVTVQADELLTLWGLNEEFFIESISESMDAERGTHNIEFICSSAVKWGANPDGGDTGFWKLGTSTLGVDTRLWFGVA